MKEKHKDLFRNCFAIGILAVCFYLLWDIKHTPKAVRNEDAGDIKMLCVTTISLVVGYYFGSSIGSSKNAETIRNMVNPPDGTTTIKTESPTPEGEGKDETKIIT